MGSDDEDDEPVLKDEPPAPISVLRRVIISRNAGRMTGSTFQQLVMSASNSGGAPCSSGMVGRRLSLITATATAAGLWPRFSPKFARVRSRVCVCART